MFFSELPMTATREATNSVWAFMALSAESFGPGCFSVTVLEFRGVRKTRRVVDRYILEPQTPELSRDGTAFFVNKTHHSGDEDTVRGLASLKRVGEVYKCEVWDDGRQHHCTCTGGATEEARSQTAETAPCVHALCLKALVDEGIVSDTASTGSSDRTGAVSGHGMETPAAESWWAEATGGRLEPEPLGC